MTTVDFQVKMVKGQGQNAGLCTNAVRSISFDPFAWKSPNLVQWMPLKRGCSLLMFKSQGQRLMLVLTLSAVDLIFLLILRKSSYESRSTYQLQSIEMQKSIFAINQADKTLTSIWFFEPPIWKLHCIYATLSEFCTEGGGAFMFLKHFMYIQHFREPFHSIMHTDKWCARFPKLLNCISQANWVHKDLLQLEWVLQILVFAGQVSDWFILIFPLANLV